MPTGYTAEVADGKVTDFRTFALRCARQFGATIMQRDDPMDEPPKHREIATYYQTRVETARRELDEAMALTVEGARAAMQAEYARRLEEQRRYATNRTETRNRYNAMLSDVIAWTAPTPDHGALKQFMIDQLTESRGFDCDYEDPEPVAPDLDDYATWIADRISNARAEVIRAEQSLREEVERCAKANAWIDALYASLPATAAVNDL